MLADETLTEEIGTFVLNSLSLKKCFILCSVIGTATNASTANGSFSINGFYNRLYLSNNLVVVENQTRYATFYAEVVGNTVRHIGTTNNNNTFQSTGMSAGAYQGIDEIREIFVDAASQNNRRFGVGTNIKVWGVKA